MSGTTDFAARVHGYLVVMHTSRCEQVVNKLGEPVLVNACSVENFGLPQPECTGPQNNTKCYSLFFIIPPQNLPHLVLHYPFRIHTKVGFIHIFMLMYLSLFFLLFFRTSNASFV